MLSDPLSLVRDATSAGIRPDPILSVSEWSDRHRMLSQKSSAEAGKWRTSRTPYLKEIMECLSPRSKVEKVIFMKGAQIGGSECGNNWTGFIIDHAPGPMMVVQPTLELAKAYSKQRIKTLIEETPKLSELVKEARERDSGNTQLMKEFRGGFLKIAGANSAASLRSMPVRYLFMDEVDAYPGDVEGEGDPVKLGEKRTATFARRKLYYVSTPTIEGRSRISALYSTSDRRRYFVPCPHCGAFQWLKWSQIKYETIDHGDTKEARNVRYLCEGCKGEIREHHKTEMLAKGEWRAERPDVGGGRLAGFHLSALYSPVGWYSWAAAAQDWLDAQGKPEELKGWINTTLGETWKEKSEAPEWERLHERREPYARNQLQKGVIFLTAGVDVQKDRLEIEIVGWGKDKQSWSIDYRVIPGDTATSEPWEALDKILMEEWSSEGGGSRPIKKLAVDSGYNTQHVYNWARKHSITRVMATKGKASASLLVGQPSPVDVTSAGRKIKRGLQLWTIGVNIGKAELYTWLKLMKPTDPKKPYPAGYCHFPEYDEEYFKMLTAEELVVRKVKGNKRYDWEKVRDRNEALDCRVLARAAAGAVGMDRFGPDQWEELEREFGLEQDEKPAPKPGSDEGSSGSTRKGSFWNR